MIVVEIDEVLGVRGIVNGSRRITSVQILHNWVTKHMRFIPLSKSQ